ncbi:MAG: hypothetical protein EZS28_023428 [Streblomastix strix]|uniref:Uncharacterized protein n=1 Tax=Streblomastix strix TaxID=222440 RepID=A0A5J4VF62_9EUKA|nr:MAG: hypothetical protein EZS28_023428 [Streblomastix strix]
MKLETNGVMTLKNINLLNNDFLSKITTLEQEVNVLQQTLGTATQDIGGLQQQINEINDELNRQTHFRGYYLLNTDIQNLPNSANGDFDFSAESGIVWMYDQNWYNSGDIVPDQVTPASDAIPLVDSGTGVAGTSNEYSRGDHKHPLQVSDVLPSKDTSVGTVGQASSYARSDHQHPIQAVDTIPNSDSADGSYGTVDSYARNDHSHPINVETNASIIPIVDGVGANGTSAYYSRHDHVHPQQLTYDGNVTATKFIKAGGLATEVLCANGDTTTIDSKLSRTYSSGTGGYIRLCVFPIGTSIGMPYIQFQVTCNTNSMQTIDLAPYYTVNGIIDLFGAITAPQYLQANYNIYYGVDQLLHTHTGSYSSAVYTAWIHMMSGSGSVTVTVSKQSSYQPTRITEILTQDIVTSITGSLTQIPSSYSLGNGGIIGNMLQVNPLDRNYTAYNNGIRIGSNNGDSSSSLYLGCIKTATNTTQTGQWEISKTNDNALTINPSSLRQTDHSVGLSINSDSSIIKFNGNQLVDVGTDQSITGIKQFNNVMQINPTNNHDYTEGLRISRSTNNQWCNINFGCDPNSDNGVIDNQWSIGTSGNDFLNPLGFIIVKAGQQMIANRGLMISADGNTLTFNGSVIAGTGATNGASNGSVNYSAGNPILWGLNSVDTNGGFYSDGPKIYWRAKPVTLGAVPP